MHHMADAAMEHLGVWADAFGVANEFAGQVLIHAGKMYHDLGRQQVQPICRITGEGDRHFDAGVVQQQAGTRAATSTMAPWKQPA
jgi:hypothetical protein